MRQRVVFTSPCRPFERIAGHACTDQMAFRLTRDQELFRLYEHTHMLGLHLLAQNISLPSVVLEYPTMDQLREEVRRGCGWVAISFKSWHTDRLLEMCRMIRTESPAAKIVLGGYGAICAPQLLAHPKWQGCVDHVCSGEGVAYMRRLLGEPADREITCRLPRIGSTLSWLSPRPMGTIGVVLSGLGCTNRCPFCVTSAYTRGRYVEVLDAAGIHRAMRGYWGDAAGTASVTIYDENFLDQRDKVMELGRRLREDETFGLRQLNYFAFGAAGAVARYEPDELLLNGLDTVWVGVESKFSPLAKLHGVDVRATFEMLHRIGVKTVGSWMVGDDAQTPENLGEDMDYFVSLDPTFQQIAILTVVPPLPLWKRMQRAGRIPPGVRSGEYHLYGNTLEYRHFTHPALLEQAALAYRRIYHENGPAVMKTLEVNLNGLEYCLRSRHARLRNDKAAFFRNRAGSYASMLKTAIDLAPSARVRDRLQRLEARCRELLGNPSPQQRMLAEAILRKAHETLRRHGPEPFPVREEPFRRYSYPAIGERPAGRPYRVEYPEGDPFLRELAVAAR